MHHWTCRPSGTPSPTLVPQLQVLPTLSPDPVRTFAVMVSPVARMWPIVVMPATEATELLGPVLAADDLLSTVSIVSSHGSMIPRGTAGIAKVGVAGQKQSVGSECAVTPGEVTQTSAEIVALPVSGLH